MNFNEYITKNFPLFRFSKPVYYQLDIALRFQLGPDEFSPYDSKTETYDERYFSEVIHRAVEIFNSVFDSNDSIYIVYQDYGYRKTKLRKGAYFFKQILDLNWETASFKKVKQMYSHDPHDTWNRVIIPTTAKKINYRNIIIGISNQDFGGRQPRVDGELYIVNIDKDIIFHMYDDRGMDIIAKEKSFLQSIYKKYENWLLDFNKKEMDKVFKSK